MDRAIEIGIGITNAFLCYPWTLISGGSVFVVIFTLLSILFGGLNVILGIFLLIISIFLGICFRFYTDSKEYGELCFKSRKNCSEQLASGYIKNTDKFSQVREPRPKMDMRITGSSIIDETLHEMVDYILRDYIHLWYDHISNDDEFIYELRKTIKDSLVTLSSRVKDVNWIPYLTTDLVDDAASHLRLYRQSLGKLRENPNNDLISVFFDLEATMEKNLCRDMACTDDSHVNDYFQGLMQALLYMLLPPETYGCSPIGSLTQDLLVNHVLIPLLHLLADPDFVNQCIIWLCQGFNVTPDILMTVIRTNDTMDELFATQDFFNQQLAELKTALSSVSGEEQNTIMQQIKCFGIVRKAIDQQISLLKEGNNRANWADDTDGEGWQHYFMTGMKLHTLTLEEVFKNSVALSYFLDFMASVGGNHYLLMFLNADAWRVSAEQQLLVIEASIKNNQTGKDQTQNNRSMLDCMRDAALNIYDQFLSEKAVPRVKLPENVVKRFYIQLKTDTINAELFDEIQRTLIEKIQTTEKFYPAFTKNKSYIKCLMELDLLKTETVSAHSASSASDDDEDLLDDLVSLTISDGNVIDSFKIQPDAAQNDEFKTCRECLKMKMQSSGFRSEELLAWEKNIWERKYKLNVEIIEAALTVEKGKTYGVYVLLATRVDEIESSRSLNENEKKWHIYRRYSDFYDFHQWIKSKWMRLNKVEFPSKQTFGKTDRSFLEKRMASLNKYLRLILSMTSEPCFGESLQDSLLHLLEPGPYTVRKKQFSEKIDSLVNMTVNPLKQSVKSVTQGLKTVPDTLINTVDGFTKIFQSRPDSAFPETIKVSSSIDTEDDNIPLRRIVILLMDEVFDLKSRNQWLRRKIVTVIRQIIKAMMGDNLNRRILDYVAHLTSPVKVAGYLRNLQQTLWPNGRKISPGVPRSPEVKLKTRFAAKASLLACMSDELKHLIGSETTRRGLHCVFDLCQQDVLNQRFMLVLLEGIIKTLYPDKPFPALIQRLHFRSSRVGKTRPFLVPTSTPLKVSTMPLENLSPRGSRKRKS